MSSTKIAAFVVNRLIRGLSILKIKRIQLFFIAVNKVLSVVKKI